MVTSETEISNLSLDLLSGPTVTNIVNPTSAIEYLCNRWYDTTRRKVLRAHPWNFARKRIVLSASNISPAFGGSKAFPVPADYMRLLYVVDDNGLPMQSFEYTMEVVGSQKCIVPSALNTGSSLNVVYVYDITDVTRFDPIFVDLLVHELALAMAFKVTESNGSVDRINQIKKDRDTLSRSINGQENPPVLITRSNSIGIRRNLSATDHTRIRF